MAQSADEKTGSMIPLIPEESALTGGYSQSKYLYYQLKTAMHQAERIDLMVSFLMESGVRMVLDDLIAAADRGAKIRILTGNYLGITEPGALYLIREYLGDRVDFRLYSDAGRSFHPKAYFFHRGEEDELFLGSSNLSRSALTSGIEWNYRLTRRLDETSYRQFYETFEDLYEHHSSDIDDGVLRQYSASWHQPAIRKDLDRWERNQPQQVSSESGQQTKERHGQEKQERIQDPVFEVVELSDGSRAFLHPKDARFAAYTRQVKAAENVTPIFQPRGAQIEALYALRQTRAEGAKKALVCAATGMGKTYLAAFDSLPYKRVLFVAHRREILRQAADSFHNVRPESTVGFFIGDERQTDRDLIFASVETLGKAQYLNREYFAPDSFDYLIIDEAHHMVTDQYQRIIRYFQPEFMLGLTATPERMDGRDIYELCDYNVPFELSLRDAINKGVLCPFHYYGIYDQTDYSGLHLVRGKYTDADLEKLFVGNRTRTDLILKYYKRYPSRRALGFCSTRRHAADMAEAFCRAGIGAAAVVSGSADSACQMGREEAIRKLRDGELRIVFSVDMFNEGLDLPDVDMVLFLRPTQSPVVFLQQLGRGLRRTKGKSYLNVLDFIGNYRMAGSAPQLLCGDNHGGRSNSGERDDPSLYPDDCIVNFDMRLIDLFRRMRERTLGVQERIDEEVDRIRDLLGHVPSRIELFTQMDEAVYTLCLTHAKQNPFRSYLEYLHRRGWLTAEEQKIYDSPGREFLDLISTTSMTRVYKMPVLASFITDQGLRTEVTDEQVLKEWKDFFSRRTNWKDIVSPKGSAKADGKRKAAYEDYLKITDAQHLANIHRNPVHFLIKSGKGMFAEKEGYAIAVTDALRDIFQDHVFRRHYEDIVEYRTMDYFRRRYVAENAAVHTTE